MKKKTIFILAIVVAVAAAGIYLAVRMSSHLTDITGVTTLPEKNRVIMNYSKQAGSFVGGEGRVTVGESGKLHVEYSIPKGSVDIAFREGTADIDFSEDSMGPDLFQGADLEHLTADGEIFGASGVSGTGALDFDAGAGEYTVRFSLHDAVGTATVTAPEQ